LFFVVLMGLMLVACGSQGDTYNYSEPSSQDAGADTDGDGLTDDDELLVHKTSPTLKDTDGDGMSDYTECVDYGYDSTNNRYRYNPLIADLPELGINLTSPPSVSLHLTDTEGNKRTFETGRSDESARTVNQSQTNSRSSSIEMSVKTTATGTVGFPPSASVSVEVGASWGFERSSSFTYGQARENRQSLSNSEAFEESNEIAASGGILMVTCEIANRGNIAFKIENIILGAVVPDFTNPGIFNPIGNLILDAGNYTSFPNMSLGPGEKLEVLNFINNGLDLTTAKNLLWDSSSLVLKPTSIELVDADGKSFSFNREEVQAKTASILIDYGGHRQTEQYRVATNADPNNWGLTIDKIMTEILDIPFEAGDTSWGGQTKQGLISVRDVANDETKNAYWVVVHSWDNGLETDAAGYNLATEDYEFGSILLKAGHKLVLVYIEDEDGDGIYSREEFLRGIIDTKVDCDEDGVAETIGDSDCDGLSDADEIIADPYVTDPRMPDTDGDGLNDYDDPNPVEKNHFEIAAGFNHNVIIKTDGTLWAWGGLNQTGELGLGHNNETFGPVQVGTADDWIRVAAGDYHTLAIKLNTINSERTLWAWGSNKEQLGFDAGQLGLGDYVNRNEPVKVRDDYDWQRVWAGGYHSIALKENRALWAWGLNNSGQIGDNTNDNRNTQQLIGSDRWQQVSSGTSHTLGIKSDGSLWAWGSNSSGQLGLGNTVSQNEPVQVGEDTDWATVSAGFDYSLAIKTDGTLYVWGGNSNGQLGIGTFEDINQLTPKAIGTGWRDVAASRQEGHTLGIKTNGTLWAWGSNLHGQLGQGDDWFMIDKYIPVQVGTDNDWVKVLAGDSHSLAVKDDGRVYTWGNNQMNQLGFGYGVETEITTPTCIMSIIPDKECP
jgi:alpha-tubulin suppressor-like RCC1 family protein